MNLLSFFADFQLYLGTGKGGTSIWGKKFEDEFHESLRVHILLNYILAFEATAFCSCY